MNNFRVRRCIHLYCRFDNKEYVDLRDILAGQSQLSNMDRILAISLLSEAEYEITRAELELLARAPQRDWIWVSDLVESSSVTRDQVISLANKGLLVAEIEIPYPRRDLRILPEFKGD